jgi:hypothetical protein
MEEKSDSYVPRTLTGMRLQELIEAQDLRPLADVVQCRPSALAAAVERPQTSQTSPTLSDE